MNKIPNAWSCFPTAFANVIDVPVADLIELIGHDGSVKPHAPPYDFMPIGFHVQECLDALWHLGYWVSAVELSPRIRPAVDAPSVEVMCRKDNAERLEYHMEDTRGVVGGVRPDGVGHAVAWLNGMFADPGSKKQIWLAQDLLYKTLLPVAYYKVGRI
jgi:hypothetical protein